MCESKRKYQYYEIVVKFANGDRESVNMLNQTNIDKCNYKEMLKVYNCIKEQYKDKDCVIEFCGSSDDSSMDVIFYKEIKTEKEDIVTNDVPIDKSLKDLHNTIQLIMERDKFLENKLSLTSKQQDFLLHKIELSDDCISEKEKINTYNEIKNIRLQRRDIKNERILLSRIKDSNIFIEMNKMLKEINRTDNKIKEREMKVKNMVEDAKILYSASLENNDVIKTVNFRSHRERISLMSQLQPKYAKIVVDDEKKTITCYNKCKGR